MLIGIPKEIKNNENRVALTPAGVHSLVGRGHRVLIETNAGLGSGFTDADYQKQGAEIVATAGEAWAAELVVKVKEPLASEYGYLRDDLLLFTYLHMAAAPELADAHLLTKRAGGAGVLLGGVPGVPKGIVTIIGGGVVGTHAARIALGLGAQVTILDISAKRLSVLEEVFGHQIQTLMSNSLNIEASVRDADVVIGAVLIPGAKAPKLVTDEMVKQMRPGSVIVDVAVDQGGVIETADRVTTHDEPVYEKHGVLHYAVANIPGAVARTSTIALTNVTLPYIEALAGKGFVQAISEDEGLRQGVTTYQGYLTSLPVAQGLDQKHTPIDELV